VAFSPDGHRLASGGIDWTARIWDARPPDDEPRSPPHWSGPIRLRTMARHRNDPTGRARSAGDGATPDRGRGSRQVSRSSIGVPSAPVDALSLTSGRSPFGALPSYFRGHTSFRPGARTHQQTLEDAPTAWFDPKDARFGFFGPAPGLEKLVSLRVSAWLPHNRLSQEGRRAQGPGPMIATPLSSPGASLRARARQSLSLRSLTASHPSAFEGHRSLSGIASRSESSGFAGPRPGGVVSCLHAWRKTRNAPSLPGRAIFGGRRAPASEREPGR